jgi:hypothetical protein
MKSILILGSGAISAAIKKAAMQRGYECDVVPLRSMRHELSDRSAVLRRYSLIIYAGYDHFSVRRNIGYIKFAVDTLKQANFDEKFVFLNTQGSLLRNIALDSLPARDNWIPNRYALTKRWQSSIVRHSGLRYADYYLPLVIGDGTGQDLQLRQLAIASGIAVPKRGENHYYFLSIESLFDKLFKNLINDSPDESRGVLLYSHYETLVDMVRFKYGGEGRYSDVRFANAYNLPAAHLVRHLALKFSRSLTAIIYYSFRTGHLRRESSQIKNALMQLDPEVTRFFALDFIPPEKITGLRVERI